MIPNLAVAYAKYLSPRFHAWANQAVIERISRHWLARRRLPPHGRGRCWSLIVISCTMLTQVSMNASGPEVTTRLSNGDVTMT